MRSRKHIVGKWTGLSVKAEFILKKAVGEEPCVAEGKDQSRKSEKGKVLSCL